MGCTPYGDGTFHCKAFDGQKAPQSLNIVDFTPLSWSVWWMGLKYHGEFSWYWVDEFHAKTCRDPELIAWWLLMFLRAVQWNCGIVRSCGDGTMWQNCSYPCSSEPTSSKLMWVLWVYSRLGLPKHTQTVDKAEFAGKGLRFKNKRGYFSCVEFFNDNMTILCHDDTTINLSPMLAFVLMLLQPATCTHDNIQAHSVEQKVTVSVQNFNIIRWKQGDQTLVPAHVMSRTPGLAEQRFLDFGCG